MNKYTVVLDANPSTHTVYADRIKLDDGLVLFLRGTDGRNSERYDGATGIVFYAPQSLVKYLSVEGYGTAPQRP